MSDLCNKQEAAILFGIISIPIWTSFNIHMININIDYVVKV